VEKQNNLFFWRAIAYLVDLGTVAMITVILQVALVFLYAIMFQSAPAQSPETLTLLARVNHITVYLAYFTLAHWYWGYTLGKKLCGLQLTCSQNISFLRSLARSFSYIASGQLTFGVGFSLALFRSDNRALHDIFCNTSVEFVRPKEMAQPQTEEADQSKAA